MYISLLFFFNDTATTEIYTLSLHDALPISLRLRRLLHGSAGAHDAARSARRGRGGVHRCARRSEEHTSELQSRLHLVCRLLLEKKKSLYFHCRTTDGLNRIAARILRMDRA